MISKEFAFLMTLSALAERLPITYLGRHIKGQLIRCGTSVSANYRAAKHGQTKAVFFQVMEQLVQILITPLQALNKLIFHYLCYK